MTDLIDIYRAERLAQDRAVSSGDWDKSFVLVGSGGLLECEWLDPFFGLFKIKGKDGLVKTESIPAGIKVIMPSLEEDNG